MEQGTKRGDYYLGLDMGTDSVGWAVTDMDYRIPKFKGKIGRASCRERV